jgi:catechol 2,3-dioxygenase-like lactoylglutathione lyase family enzyme
VRKSLPPLLAAALTLACAIPSAVAQQTTADLAGIAHVAIRVADLEQSRAFFHKLGFEEAFAMNNGGTPTEAFFKINDRQFIELYPRRGSDGDVGFMHICFEAADINAVHDDYVAHGLQPNAVRRAGAGNLLFTLQGPDEPDAPSDLRSQPTQNIEYTQYMPGSKHTLDRGQHLGPNRIADTIAGVGIPFSDPQTATTYYEQKLSFRPAAQSLEHGSPSLALPGNPHQRIEVLPPSTAQEHALPFRLLFGVSDLHATSHKLHKMGFKVEKQHGALVIHDPDGDAIVFLADSAPE